ncbi:MAG: hypothetical protein M0R51_14245, partial [Clostridia bacterium]|nr:hypothetical protein [Clostridia bacterium]
NGTKKANINYQGYLYIGGISDLTTSANAFVELKSTGTTIKRNVNDANPALIINEAKGTGDIVKFQFGGTTLSSITKDGVFDSDVVTGTAPFSIASTTVNTNLNADLLDGKHASELATSDHTQAVNKGGTNITSYTAGDILYATDATTLAKLEVPADADTVEYLLTIDQTTLVPKYTAKSATATAPTESLLATRTTTGGFSVADLDNYDYIVLELRVQTSGGEDPITITNYYERTQMPSNKFSYTFTDNSPLPDSETVYGMKLTSFGAENTTACQFTLMPTGAAKTSVYLAVHGTAPTTWEVKIYGGSY